jgi:hypothetical protein
MGKEYQRGILLHWNELWKHQLLPDDFDVYTD